ncbi:MAG: hypothetical protein GY774_01680 [Planctomycetes bacterium]|nr:hypothetical protein [Planctomycetota bacterium]
MANKKEGRFAPEKPASVLEEGSKIVETPDLSASSLSETLAAILQGEDDLADNSTSIIIGASICDIKIKKKIWLGSYVDLGCLAPRSDIKPRENLSPLLQLTTASPKHRPPATIDEWRRWFHVYATIYTSRFNDAAPQMFEYVNRIYGLHAKHPNTYIWRLYDEEFRRYKASHPKTNWHELEPKCLAAVEEEYVVSNRRKGGADKSGGVENFPRNGTCHHWNRGDCTTKGKCRFTHVCCWCKQDHKAIFCKNKK